MAAMSTRRRVHFDAPRPPVAGRPRAPRRAKNMIDAIAVTITVLGASAFRSEPGEAHDQVNQRPRQ